MIALMLLISLVSGSALACDIAFDCKTGTALINGKRYGMVCGAQTARGIAAGTIGTLIHANGRWRPGLVRPGTPMLTTSPPLCADCFIHVSGLGHSNGCLGTTAAAFAALQACAGSRFAITPR